jgi:hypothetical protein
MHGLASADDDFQRPEGGSLLNQRKRLLNQA